MLPPELPEGSPHRNLQNQFLRGADSVMLQSGSVAVSALGAVIAIALGLGTLNIILLAVCGWSLSFIVGALVLANRRAKADDERLLAEALKRQAIIDELASGTKDDLDEDVDPILAVDCIDGREAILLVSTDRPTRLKAQGKIISITNGEIERGDQYPVLWRIPGTGGFTTQFQDLRPGTIVPIAVARVPIRRGYNLRPSVWLEILGDGGLVQRVEAKWPSGKAEAEISVNIFGGKVGRLCFAHHFQVTATRGSNVVTIRPITRPAAVPTGGVNLSNRMPRTQ